MNSKKVLSYIFILFIFIVPIAEAYQELHEPDIIYIEYALEDSAYNTIGMYESAANTLINNVGKDCFQRLDSLDSSTTNGKYLLSGTKSCNADNSLFSKVLEFYKEALNAPQDETVMDMATKIDVEIVMIKDKKELIALSVEVNKAKKIITSLSM